MQKKLPLVKNDPWLAGFEKIIIDRYNKAIEKETELLSQAASLADFATGYLYFGLHKMEDRWVIREWAPNATKIFMVGDFNQWQEQDEYALKRIKGTDNWELELPSSALKHGQFFHFIIHWNGGRGERIPAWIRRVVQDKDTKLFSAQVWDIPVYQWKNPRPSTPLKNPIIYEAHVGMAVEEERIGSYAEFRDNILPRIAELGYNTVQLMAIQEHPYYGSFGYHVSSFFAPSSRFGTPEDLKSLIDKAHGMGIRVIMDLVHSHAVKNELEGLGRFDGTGYQFFHDGVRREHVAWDSLCFNYNKNEVLHFLLSNCKYWLDEFHFDGFRFDGVTSMLYYDHGLSKSFTRYEDYYDGNQDGDAIAYLMLANRLIHQVFPNAITIAEEVSGMPGLASPVEYGGYGFDYRLAMGTPDYWIKIIKERKDEDWKMGELFYELTRKRKDERTIGYAESHDQALVGDKTIIFRLVDRDMYDFMSKFTPNLNVDRGIALHKLIRFITLLTAGDGYLNFMGNEFGHPEWIDFPREGNGWSYKYARRQWSLVDKKDLKYHYLNDFDRDIISFVKKEKILEKAEIYQVVANDGDKVLAFERKGLVYVFNFNPNKSFTDYGIPLFPGKYKIVFNTDMKKYGGQELVDMDMTYYASKSGKATSNDPYYVKLYLPSRTALILKKEPTKSVYDL